MAASLIVLLSLLGSGGFAGTAGAATTRSSNINTGWTRIVGAGFNHNSATGSWGSDWDWSKVVYTGGSNDRWVTYPKSWYDTQLHRHYRSDKVLSTHDGVLDFNLHTADGKPTPANPSPMLSQNSQNMTYGQYSARLRVSNKMSGFYIAFLLWPKEDKDWQCAESDFPETPLSSTNRVHSFSHHGCSGDQDVGTANVDMTKWHTYTQQWGPGFRRYLIDGKEVSRSTKQVYNKPMRWQLQVETVPTSKQQNGHIYVDSVNVYKWNGARL